MPRALQRHADGPGWQHLQGHSHQIASLCAARSLVKFSGSLARKHVHLRPGG
ncbi:hypothetical protein THIX_30853 [Thiomonas sp. X19]|nr:hypothetical protein THIX_30853 [Thiomonas sp. X19]